MNYISCLFKTCLLFLFISTFFTACKKENNQDEIDEPQNNYENPKDYTKYEVGNYWIYESKTCDSLGENCQVTGSLDSIYISKDTMINNKKYFEVFGRSPYLGQGFRRDSANFIVDERGNIHFSTSSFNSVLYQIFHTARTDTITIERYVMDSTKNNIQVTAGNFECLTLVSNTYRDIDEFNINRPMYFHYAKGVGLVKHETYAYSRPDLRLVRELVRYHVN